MDKTKHNIKCIKGVCPYTCHYQTINNPQYWYIKKTSHLSYDVCWNSLPICKHSISHVLANILKQSIQSCTPLVNKQFAPGFHSD